MITLSDIRTEVIQKLQENSSPEYWSLDELNSYINDSIREVVRDLKLLKRFTLLMPLAMSGFYALPSDAVEVLGVYYNGKPLTKTSVENLDYSFTKYRHLRQNANEEFYSFQDWRTAKGEPLFWLIYDNNIRIVPYMDEVSGIGGEYGFYMSGDGTDWGFYFPYDVTYSDNSGFGGIYYLASVYGSPVYIDYVYSPEPLVNDSDIAKLPDVLKKAVVYRTLFECFSREGDLGDQRRAIVYLQFYDDEITRYKNTNMFHMQPRYVGRFI